MEDISKQIKELEIKGKKYDDLKEFIQNKLPKIYENIDEIKSILNEINPVLSILTTKGTTGIHFKKGQRGERVNEIYKDMVDNESEYTLEDIERKYDTTKSASYAIFKILNNMKGVSSRVNNKIKTLFYFESSGTQEELKKILPKDKISIMG